MLSTAKRIIYVLMNSEMRKVKRKEKKEKSVDMRDPGLGLLATRTVFRPLGHMYYTCIVRVFCM